MAAFFDQVTAGKSSQMTYSKSSDHRHSTGLAFQIVLGGPSVADALTNALSGDVLAINDHKKFQWIRPSDNSLWSLIASTSPESAFVKASRHLVTQALSEKQLPVGMSGSLLLIGPFESMIPGGN